MSFIGVFDSGIGGLSILNALHQRFPFEQFIYLADGQHLPYGDKSMNELAHIFNKNINYFTDSKGIIVACNTMSCFIESDTCYTVPVIGIIDSLIMSADKYYNNIHSIGVLGTSYTINSQTYLKHFENISPQYPIYQVAAPLLASALEHEDPDTWDICRRYIDQFPKDMSHLILACTHYNLLFDKIQENYPHLVIIDPYRQILHLVDSTIPKNNDSEIKPIQFFTTKYTEVLQKISEEIMQQSIRWNKIEL